MHHNLTQPLQSCEADWAASGMMAQIAEKEIV